MSVIELDVFKISGEKSGSMSVDLQLMGEPASPALMHRAVVSYEANARQGDACTKTRGDRAGSGKKLWKQKGTGRARMGSIRSPLWRGGGVTFGPKPRDYRMKVSKKERQSVLKTAVAGKLRDGEVRILDSFQLEELKTKKVAAFIKGLSLKGTVLFVSQEYNPDWLQASRNLKSVNTLPSGDLNALEVLKGRTVVFEKKALENMIQAGGME